MNKVIVCGGRDFIDYDFVSKTLNYINKHYPINLIIQGGAKGADTLAKNWAIENNVYCDTYNANWNEHGRAAGPIRNTEMLEKGCPDFVIAFPGGKGTNNMIEQAQKKVISVLSIKINDNEEYVGRWI